MTASVVYLSAVRIDTGVDWEASKGRMKWFSVVRKLDGAPFPTGFEAAVGAENRSAIGVRNGGCMISMQSSERALLANLIARLGSLDADVLVGHNAAVFDFDVLLHRLQHHKVHPLT